MNKLSMLFIFIFILGWSNASHTANFLPDEPEIGRDLSVTYQAMDSYNQALGIWNKGISIYKPSEFFETKAGVCVDLARFGIETLRIIDPNSDPKYLMIEFDPIQINSNTFRLHWLVSFKKDGVKYFFCDSKSPGYIAGPFNSTQVFISEYEQYRDRKIVAYRELESYKKQRKSQSAKGINKKSPNKTNAGDGQKQRRLIRSVGPL